MPVAPGASDAESAQRMWVTGAASEPSKLTPPSWLNWIVVPVPEALYPRIEQSGIVLARAKDPALARAFLAFLAGEKGRAILAKYGYGLP